MELMLIKLLAILLVGGAIWAWLAKLFRARQVEKMARRVMELAEERMETAEKVAADQERVDQLEKPEDIINEYQKAREYAESRRD